MDLIEKLIVDTGLFSELDQKKLQLLVSKIEQIEIPASTTFIHEGEQADALFIILEGEGEVFFLDDFKREVSLNRIKEGEFFGEQSLISITPGIRNASVRAITPLKLIKISHKTYREFENPDQTIDERLKDIGFQQLLVKFRKRSVDLDFAKFFFDPNRKYETRCYKPGETIITAGEPSDGIYFLLSGNVDIYKGEELISSQRSGSVFGELGVITRQPRVATIKAKSPVKTIFLSDKEFYLLTKNKPELQTIIDIPMKSYQIESGEVLEFTGNFLGMPALISHYYLKNGHHFIASSVKGTTLHSIINPLAQVNEEAIFIKDRIYRQLHLMNGRLVGVTTYGPWDYFNEISKKVIANARIPSELLDYFKMNGELKK